MAEFADDPVNNAIYAGIKEDIEVAYTHGRYRATIILTLAGIDSMAYLDMPAGQSDVTKSDFVRWAERYIRFPCEEQLTGKDLYGARCAMLHTYGVASRMSRNGECRMVGYYLPDSYPPVRANRSLSSDLVVVSVGALKDAFFRGIDEFLVNVYADNEKAAIVEPRLQALISLINVEKKFSDAFSGPE